MYCAVVSSSRGFYLPTGFLQLQQPEMSQGIARCPVEEAKSPAPPQPLENHWFYVKFNFLNVMEELLVTVALKKKSSLNKPQFPALCSIDGNKPKSQQSPGNKSLFVLCLLNY